MRPIVPAAFLLLAVACIDAPKVLTDCAVEIPSVTTEWTAWAGTLGAYEVYVVAGADLDIGEGAVMGTEENLIIFGIKTGEDLSAAYPDECGAEGTCWVKVGFSENVCLTGDGEATYDLTDTSLRGDLTLKFPYEEAQPYALIQAAIVGGPYESTFEDLELDSDRATGYEGEDDDTGAEDGILGW